MVALDAVLEQLRNGGGLCRVTPERLVRGVAHGCRRGQDRSYGHDVDDSSHGSVSLFQARAMTHPTTRGGLVYCRKRLDLLLTRSDRSTLEPASVALRVSTMLSVCCASRSAERPSVTTRSPCD